MDDDDRRRDILLLQSLIEYLPSPEDSFTRWRKWRLLALEIIDVIGPEDTADVTEMRTDPQ